MRCSPRPGATPLRRCPSRSEAAWRAAALAQSVGATADLSRALADTTGAVEALADDVVERYRAPLV